MHNVNRLVALKLIIANIKVEICGVDKLVVQRNMTRQRKPRIVMVGAVEVFPFHLSFVRWILYSTATKTTTTNTKRKKEKKSTSWAFEAIQAIITK